MPDPKNLKKGLGPVHVFAIAAGAMIGSGLFILPGLAHAQAGPGVILSYLFAGIFGLVFVLFELGVEAFLISSALILVAFCIFWFYGRKQMEQESALLHLIARLTDRDPVSGELEAELKEIIRDRDDIQLDRFDRLVENAPVLDLEDPLSKERFFELASEQLADRLAVDAQDLKTRLQKRAREGSAVLNPFLAVPQVMLEGSGQFELLIARSAPGIEFSSEAGEVHAVFVLAGTDDERNARLRALCAIARITQSSDFEPAWLEAKGRQVLRDIILLSDRRRPR